MEKSLELSYPQLLPHQTMRSYAHDANPLSRGASHAEKVPLLGPVYRIPLEVMTSVPLRPQAYPGDTVGSVLGHRNKVSDTHFLVSHYL